MPCPAFGQVGDVVGGRDVLEVAEPPARVERPVAGGGQRLHRAGERVGRVDGRFARRAGGQVAREQVVGGLDARAVLEVSADVERRSDHLQGLDVPDRLGGRGAERLPARAVPDREVVGAAVPRVRERATGVDLAAGDGDGEDLAVRDLLRRRADRAPGAAVPLRDAIGVGDPAGVGELAADVEGRPASPPAQRRRGSATWTRGRPRSRGGPSRRGLRPAPTSRSRRRPLQRLRGRAGSVSR